MEITTRNGYTFYVDECDLKLAKEKGWYGQTFRHKRVNGDFGKYRFYIVRHFVKSNGKLGIELLHRRILNIEHGSLCDHINGNTLDCRRSNLRLCNNSQNQHNKAKLKNNTSGYKGVWWHSIGKKWEARIMVNRENKYLGLFNTKESAALAYNYAAIKYHGEFARLNELKSR
jgi:hypothetical protein